MLCFRWSDGQPKIFSDPESAEHLCTPKCSGERAAGRQSRSPTATRRYDQSTRIVTGTGPATCHDCAVTFPRARPPRWPTRALGRCAAGPPRPCCRAGFGPDESVICAVYMDGAADAVTLDQTGAPAATISADDLMGAALLELPELTREEGYSAALTKEQRFELDPDGTLNTSAPGGQRARCPADLSWLVTMSWRGGRRTLNAAATGADKSVGDRWEHCTHECVPRFVPCVPARARLN